MNKDNRTKVREKLYRDRNLQLIFGITLTAVMGVASISPAFPKMIEGLGITEKEVGFLITIFTLPGVILTPVLGILADRWGRKKVLVPSLVLFGVAGGACALARDFHVLLLFRFFQGVGAASLGSLNATLIGDLYRGRQRTAALGYNAGILSIGTASYPAIGGLLATFAWHYPFFLPLAAIPLGLLVLLYLKNPEPGTSENFTDYLKNSWRSIGSRKVAVLFATGLVTFINLYGAYLTFLPLLLGHSFGARPLVIGLIMSSMSVSTAVTSFLAGRWSKNRTEKSLLQVAFILYGFALLAVPFVDALWMFTVPAVVLGVAMGINMPVVLSLLTAQAPPEYRAAFMSLNGLVLRLGQTAGPLIMTAVYALWGITGVFVAGAALSGLLVVLLSLALE